MTNSRAKVALSHYPDYLKATATSLNQVYGKYSKKKADAFDYCRKLCSDLGGEDIRILSSNGWAFTVGFTFVKDGKKMFAYITKDHNSFCEL